MEYLVVNDHPDTWMLVHDRDFGSTWVDLTPEVEAWAEENGIRMTIQYDEDGGEDILVVLPDARAATLFKLRWL